jgi:predicted SprT family Zn-dependent metalloprotease
MKIPKKLVLFGETITIKYDDNLNDREEYIGAAHYKYNEIILQRPNHVFNKERIEQTFYHELIHYILHKLGYHKLKTDEKLVDTIGSLLYQAHKTMEY